MRSHLLAIASLACVTVAGLADNQVTVWSFTSGDYDVWQNPPEVHITGPGTYKIQATDPAVPGGLGYIELISVTQPVSGTVEIYILRDPAAGFGDYEPGAKDIYEINLGNAEYGKWRRRQAHEHRCRRSERVLRPRRHLAGRMGYN